MANLRDAEGSAMVPSDPLEATLLLAANAGRFDVVVLLAKELEARRLVRAAGTRR